MERRTVSTGTTWEEENGYSRAVRVGPFVYVAGPNADREVGRAHAEFFGDVCPCCTLVGVARLASPLASIEVEIEAVVADDA